MKLFHFAKDGGKDSTVAGYWLVEMKALFSVVLLVFENGSRDAYHEHAFNSISWVLKGELREQRITKQGNTAGLSELARFYRPSLMPIFTRRSHFHQVRSVGRTYVLSLRGPWSSTWREWLPREQRFRTLAHGRKEVA